MLAGLVELENMQMLLELFPTPIRRESPIDRQSTILVIKATKVFDILCRLVWIFDKSIQISLTVLSVEFVGAFFVFHLLDLATPRIA